MAKPKLDTQLPTTRVTSKLKEQIERIADEKELNITDVIRDALQQYVDKYEKDQP